jgi:hypothetical protein
LIDVVFLASTLAWAHPNQAEEAAKAGLTEAAIASRDVERCAAISAQWEPQFEALSTKEFKVQERIQGFLGRSVEPATEALLAAQPAVTPRCSDEFVNGAVPKVDSALARVERVAERLELATTTGTWLGLFPICGARYASLASTDAGDPAARIELQPEQAKAFAAYRDLFLPSDYGAARMSLRVNGEIVARPGVYGGGPVTVLTLSGRSITDAETILASAHAACDV